MVLNSYEDLFVYMSRYIRRDHRVGADYYSSEERDVHNDNYRGNYDADYYDSYDDDRRDDSSRRSYIKNQLDTRGRDSRKYYDNYDGLNYDEEWDDEGYDDGRDYDDYDNRRNGRCDYETVDNEGYDDGRDGNRLEYLMRDNGDYDNGRDSYGWDDRRDYTEYDSVNNWEYEGRGRGSYGYGSDRWDSDGCRGRRYESRKKYQDNQNRDRMRRGRKKKKISGFLIAVIIVAAAVLVFCAFKLAGIFKSYSDSTNYYNEIMDQVAGGEQNVQGHASLNWDYSALLEMSEDAVGYIYQKDTVISYPIMQAEDNDKYLRALMNGEYSIGGTLFVDYRCEGALDAQYAIIYGHNMDDGSMFGSITSYKDETYYQQHKTFEIYSGEKMYTYYVYAAFQAAVDDELGIFTIPSSDDEFLSRMEMIRAQNSYEMDDIEISADSHVAVLTTCIDYPRDYNYRYIVVLVRGEELLPAEDADSIVLDE